MIMCEKMLKRCEGKVPAFSKNEVIETGFTLLLKIIEQNKTKYIKQEFLRHYISSNEGQLFV